MPIYYLQALTKHLHFEEPADEVTVDKILKELENHGWGGPVEAPNLMDACSQYWSIGPDGCDCGERCNNCYHICAHDTVFAVRDRSGNIIVFRHYAEIFDPTRWFVPDN